MPLTPRSGQVVVDHRTDRIRAKVGELPEHIRDLSPDEVMAFLAYQGEENADRFDTFIEDFRKFTKSATKRIEEFERLSELRHEATMKAIANLADSVRQARQRDAELERRIRRGQEADVRLERKVIGVRDEAIAEARKSRPDDQLVGPLLKVVEVHAETQRVQLDRQRAEEEERAAKAEWAMQLSKARWKTALLGAKLALKWLFGLGGAALLIGTAARGCDIDVAPAENDNASEVGPAPRQRR